MRDIKVKAIWGRSVCLYVYVNVCALTCFTFARRLWIQLVGQFCKISDRQWLVTRNSPMGWNRCCSLRNWKILPITDIIHNLEIGKSNLIWFRQSMCLNQQSEGEKSHEHAEALPFFRSSSCFSTSTDKIRWISYCITQSPCCQEAIDLHCSRQSLHQPTERRRGRNRAAFFLKQEDEWYSPAIACTRANVHSLGVAAYSVLTWVSPSTYLHISFIMEKSFLDMSFWL